MQKLTYFHNLRPHTHMSSKKRTSQESAPEAKRPTTSGDVVVVVVSGPDIPVVDMFVVPLAELGDDRQDVESLLKVGLTQDEAYFHTDSENLPADGSPLVLYRLGLLLGVLSPADADDDVDRAWEEQLSRRLVHTKLTDKASYHGPSIGVLSLMCI